VLDISERLFRIAKTGLAFSLFGLGGLLLAVTVFPLISLLTPGNSQTRKRIRGIIHRVFKLFLWFVQAIGLYEIKVNGAEKLATCRGCLVVANHPTLLDVVILMALNQNFQCVVKHQLWRNVFLRGVVSAAGFIRNDLSAEEFIEQCAKSFAAGDNLLLFPEGTRTIPGEFPKLFRGFANIAILSQADIQIVVIQCEPVTLTREEPWYAVSESRARFQVNVGDLWGKSTFARTPHRSLNARRLVRSLESYYQDALSNGPTGS
jgi:1-acyl-sn-glycerol-3-phosphate acyltransferase